MEGSVLPSMVTLVGPRVVRKRKQPLDPDNPFSLARDFAGKLKASGYRGVINCGALAKHFSAWKKNGVAVEEIRLTFDYYFMLSQERPGACPWRSYLNQQDKLLHWAERRYGELEAERNRGKKIQTLSLDSQGLKAQDRRAAVDKRRRESREALAAELKELRGW